MGTHFLQVFFLTLRRFAHMSDIQEKVYFILITFQLVALL